VSVAGLTPAGTRSNPSCFRFYLHCVQIDFGDAKKVDEPPLEDEPRAQSNNESEPSGPDNFSEDVMSMHSDASMDRRGTLVGTMNYLAPEMIQE